MGTRRLISILRPIFTSGLLLILIAFAFLLRHAGDQSEFVAPRHYLVTAGAMETKHKHIQMRHNTDGQDMVVNIRQKHSIVDERHMVYIENNNEIAVNTQMNKDKLLNTIIKDNSKIDNINLKLEPNIPHTITEYHKTPNCNIAAFNSQFALNAPPALAFHKNAPPLNLYHIEGCQRIIYNRVPKCGSRTVVTMLRRVSNLTANQIAGRPRYDVIAKQKPTHKTNYFEQAEQEDIWLNDFNGYQPPFVFTQHLHFVNMTSIGPVAFINVIRDPAERFISHYFYKIYGSPNDHRNITRQSHMTLEECISQENSYCHRIHEILPFFCGQDPRCREDSEWALLRAKRNYDANVAVVGFTEDLRSFMHVLEGLWPNLFSGIEQIYTKAELASKDRTRTAYKPEVSQQTLTRIRNMLKHEYDFYQYVKQRFYMLHRHVINMGTS